MAENSAHVDSRWPIVENGRKDVARRINGEQMMVEAEGRVPYQIVYLHTQCDDDSMLDEDKPATNLKYDPNVESMYDRCPILPKDQELVPATNAKAYLEVGLVYAEDPERFLQKGKSRDKKKDAEMQARGILRRGDMLRAFTPVDEHIPKQTKYYVGCKFDGRLHPRVIVDVTIFFYPEVYDGLDIGLPTKKLKVEVNRACKTYAARNKCPAERIKISINEDDVEKLLERNPFHVKRTDNVVNSLALQYDLFTQTGDCGHLQAMLEAMESARPDLHYGPWVCSEGVNAFADFEEPLTAEMAGKAAEELKRAIPSMRPLDPQKIMAVHEILRSYDSKGETLSENATFDEETMTLGDTLSLHSLGFFLEAVTTPLSSQELTIGHIKYCMDLTEIYARHASYYVDIRAARPSTPPKKGPKFTVGPQIATEDVRRMLAIVKLCLGSLDDSTKQHLEAAKELHGAILKHGSITEIMETLAHSVDRSTTKMCMEQLGAIAQGVEVVARRQVIAEHTEPLLAFVDNCLLNLEEK